MVSDQTSQAKSPTRKLLATIGKLWSGLDGWIPLGYENESGFHYGIDFIASILVPSLENRATTGLP